MVAVWLAIVAAFAQGGPAGPAVVIDGDSLIVGGVEVRLHGVDAPEWDQTCWNADRVAYPCGRRVAQAVAGFVRDREVSCLAIDVDPYGRTVAKCFVGAVDLGAVLVGAGGAVAYVRFSHDYVAAETLAQARLKGVWSGTFDPPDRWRRLSDRDKERRVEAVEASLAADPTGRSVRPLD